MSLSFQLWHSYLCPGFEETPYPLPSRTGYTWYESLSLELYDCGDNRDQIARCILAYLSMDVPRSWWERALETGVVGSTWAGVLCDLQVELTTALNPDEPLSPGLLVALAFIDDDRAENLADCFGDVGSRHTPDEYLARAIEILAERPDLAQLGAMIEQAAVKTAPPDGSS